MKKRDRQQGDPVFSSRRRIPALAGGDQAAISL
jgi:hypothetical protein